MLTTEQTEYFNQILREIGISLGITKSQYDAAVASYQFVGQWLSRPDSSLSSLNPEILPQGSFLLGTMVRPVHEDDDLDIDLVCRLASKGIYWTQADVKRIVGEAIKEHATLKRMLDTEGRRCWTLLHREEAKFHMDILPAVINETFVQLLERKQMVNENDARDLAIRITDMLMYNYKTATDIADWLKSNPFGYALWFKARAALQQNRLFSLNEVIQPVPEFLEDKLPLQIIVQLLKRHRDIMFNGDCDKPISIIITTLAARAYGRQESLIEGLIAVVNTMENFIEDKLIAGQFIKWIGNPVNAEENYADKWVAEPQKQSNFYKWLRKLKTDLDSLLSQRGSNVQIVMSEIFGSRDVNKAFSDMGTRARQQRESGAMKMAAGTGIIGSIGRTTIPPHNPFGSRE